MNQNQHFTLREDANVVGVSHITAESNRHADEYFNRADVWFPHDLSERQLTQRILICDQLVKKQYTIFSDEYDHWI